MIAFIDSLNFWYVWPIGIALWLLLGWSEFGVIEARAFANPGANRITLSYCVYFVCTKFPLATFLGGLIIGGFTIGLGVHFFWHWCPPGSLSAG